MDTRGLRGRPPEMLGVRKTHSFLKGSRSKTLSILLGISTHKTHLRQQGPSPVTWLSEVSIQQTGCWHETSGQGLQETIRTTDVKSALVCTKQPHIRERGRRVGGRGGHAGQGRRAGGGGGAGSEGQGPLPLGVRAVVEAGSCFIRWSSSAPHSLLPPVPRSCSLPGRARPGPPCPAPSDVFPGAGVLGLRQGERVWLPWALMLPDSPVSIHHPGQPPCASC